MCVRFVVAYWIIVSIYKYANAGCLTRYFRFDRDAATLHTYFGIVRLYICMYIDEICDYLFEVFFSSFFL